METDLYTGNALMNMYAKLQVSLLDCHVFDEIPQSDRGNSGRSSLGQDSEIGIDGIGKVPVLHQETRNGLIRSEKGHFEFFKWKESRKC
uniref:Putative ovule protein n=1 Tax=Solanum chacoense TaxID=4108 RepID=A0A0V0GPY7_SOLCH